MFVRQAKPHFGNSDQTVVRIVNVADGSDLVVGNDVRQGGFRIGLVSSVKPVPLQNGQVGAQLLLKLDQANGSVPTDSTASIVPRSVLGLKYVELQKGTSSNIIPDGGVLPLSRTSVPVQFDDVFKTFDSKTRVAVQDSLTGAGDALTARGSALNDTISSLPPLFLHLQPVAKYLSDPSTNLTGFFDNLERFDWTDVRPTKGSCPLGDASAVIALRYAQRATQRSTRQLLASED